MRERASLGSREVRAAACIGRFFHGRMHVAAVASEQ